MKLVLVAVVCLTLVAVIVSENARPRDHKHRIPNGKFTKRCSTQIDCGDNECCVGSRFRSGKCKKLTIEGCRCSSGNTEIFGKYRFACPCAEGLSCVPNNVTPNKYGKVRYNERCRAPSVSTLPPTEAETEEEPKLDSDESTEENTEEKR